MAPNFHTSSKFFFEFSFYGN